MEKKIVCFLIDDDVDDQEIFQLAIEDIDLKIDVRIADDGYNALEIINCEPEFIPDFIFLDLNMPRVDGRQCLAEIRKIARYDEVPVIIYTTSKQQYHKEEVDALGATDFVTKPSEISKLTEILNQIFTNNQSSTQQTNNI